MVYPIALKPLELFVRGRGVPCKALCSVRFVELEFRHVVSVAVVLRVRGGSALRLLH